jgi:hypothetical protein
MRNQKKELDEIEKCVICKKETKYSKNTHINEREFYVKGIGQLCENCAYKLFTERLYI